MGTTSTGLTSSAFNGTSQYATDLQNAITRAVSFASLPVQQLQNSQNDLTNQNTEVQSLQSLFGSLQSALDAVNQSVGTGSYAASVDNSTVASASVGSGASVGSFSVNVTSLGSLTNTMSDDGLTTVSDPSSQSIDSSTSYTLSANGNTYQISNPSGTLNGLAQAINQSAADVQATIVNVGSSSSPDYRLSVQSQQYSPNVIQLSDGTDNLLNALNTGSYVTYQVNGQPSTPIQATSRTATISPGISVNFLATGTADVTVSQNAASLSNSLSSFANAYNAVVDELNKSRGQNGGALAGQSIVFSLQSTLRNLAAYSDPSGTTTSLASLGLTFDQNGHLQFESTALSQSSSSISSILSFLGSESTGGFLQNANDILASANDPTTGVLAQTSQSLTNQIADLTTKINDDNARISLMQTNLTAEMSQADATISSLESQVNYFTSLFTQERANALAGQ